MFASSTVCELWHVRLLQQMVRTDVRHREAGSREAMHIVLYRVWQSAEPSKRQAGKGPSEPLAGAGQEARSPG